MQHDFSHASALSLGPIEGSAKNYQHVPGFTGISRGTATSALFSCSARKPSRVISETSR